MISWHAQLSEWIRTACGMEVACPKPGNVGPQQPFSHATAEDFLRSADAVAPVLSHAERQPLGQTILQAVQATRSVVSHNTNLGIILLTAPLAAVPPEQSLVAGITRVLDSLTVEDSRLVYQAILLAEPGGLGTADQQDLHCQPTVSLRECMRLAADRDMIARQYANEFQEVLCLGVDLLRESRQVTASQSQQITWVALKYLAEFGDSLVARRCGREVSAKVRTLAAQVLADGWPASQESRVRLEQFDQFLRADGHRRNPGTTADLIAALLFSALREGWLVPEDDWWKIDGKHA